MYIGNPIVRVFESPSDRHKRLREILDSYGSKMNLKMPVDRSNEPEEDDEFLVAVGVPHPLHKEERVV